MVEFLKNVKRQLVSALRRWRMRRQVAQAFAYDRRQFEAGAGALHLDRRAAAVSEIVMGYHVLEKGLTMPNRRKGFGCGAVVHLVNLITAFERNHGSDGQVRHAVAVLRAYAEMHHDTMGEMPRLQTFLDAHPDVPAAVEPHVTREAFFKDVASPFPAFAASRHVVRHFAGPVPRERLEAAVALATTAPSACNRQHARVHVLENAALRDRLFALQGGTRGFGQDARQVLVVTVDLSTVRWGWERHDGYVNGGIFVMNLCYALHFNRIAHCILHWSVPPNVDREAHALLGIPSNEAIVQVIACGEPPAEFDVAASPRLDLKDILTWRDETEGGLT